MNTMVSRDESRREQEKMGTPGIQTSKMIFDYVILR